LESPWQTRKSLFQAWNSESSLDIEEASLEFTFPTLEFTFPSLHFWISGLRSEFQPYICQFQAYIASSRPARLVSSLALRNLAGDSDLQPETQVAAQISAPQARHGRRSPTKIVLLSLSHLIPVD